MVIYILFEKYKHKINLLHHNNKIKLKKYKITLFLKQNHQEWTICLGQNLTTNFNYSTTTPNNKINMTIYFKNLTIRLHVLYILNIYIKFRANRMLFITRFINLFLRIITDYKNLKFKYLIGYSYWSLIFWKFCKHREYMKKIMV